jgi:REP element-mobilizing transposase RayT
VKKLFKNKYRSDTSRLKGWDYSNPGRYFITICAYNKDHLFGEIKGGIMELSNFGQIALQEWWKSFDMRTELFCDAFVIMPNHIHGIVRIDKITGNPLPVGTHGRASQQQQQQQNHGVAYRSPKSVSSFVAGFKSSATKKINECRQLPKNPVWQSRFHDHIIRNEIEFHSIKNYIINNPRNWKEDCFFEL